MGISAYAIVAAALLGPMAASDRIDTLYLFSGASGAMAYTIDRTGSNLPRQYGPWKFQKPVSTAGWTFRTGADKAALGEVRKQGYAVRRFKMIFEPAAAKPDRRR